MTKVAIVMGSTSDMPVMQDAIDILKEFGIEVDVDIVSAHRTPEKLFEFGKNAHKNGYSAIIAAAGGAAHLPGMVASLTPLPVIGVPVALKYLDGMDSLLSIVQMPTGVPVATVAIGHARNAGLLAVRILAASDAGLRTKMEEFAESLAKEARAKGQSVRGSVNRTVGFST